MVTARSLTRLLNNSEEFARAAGTSEAMVKKILKLAETDIIKRRRQPSPTPPAGSISQSEGARKYKLDQATVSRWVRGGIIPALLRTTKEVYIDENKLAKVATSYHKKPGRGRRTVQKKFKPQSTI